MCVCVCVCADEIEKTTGPISKFFLQLTDLPSDIVRKKLNFSLSQPISSNWMILNLNVEFGIIENDIRQN